MEEEITPPSVYNRAELDSREDYLKECVESYLQEPSSNNKILLENALALFDNYHKLIYLQEHGERRE